VDRHATCRTLSLIVNNVPFRTESAAAPTYSRLNLLDTNGRPTTWYSVTTDDNDRPNNDIDNE